MNKDIYTDVQNAVDKFEAAIENLYNVIMSHIEDEDNSAGLFNRLVDDLSDGDGKRINVKEIVDEYLED